jgi:hypothetical protein
LAAAAKAAFNLRRILLRVTALPIFLVIVKPKRAVPPFSAVDRSRTSIRNAGVEDRRPPRTARNSGRDLRVGSIGIRTSRADGHSRRSGSRDKMRACRRSYHDGWGPVQGLSGADIGERRQPVNSHANANRLPLPAWILGSIERNGWRFV